MPWQIPNGASLRERCIAFAFQWPIELQGAKPILYHHRRTVLMNGDQKSRSRGELGEWKTMEEKPR